MRWELRKFLGNPFVVLLLLGTILLNGVLFYNHCMDDTPGYSFLHMRQKYDRQTDLAAEQERLNEWLANPIGTPRGIDLVTGDPYQEFGLNNAILERMSEIETYPAYLKQVQAQALARMKFGLAGEPDSATYRGQERIVEIYSKLEGLVPETGFFGGVEVLTHWLVTDLMLLLFGLTGGLFLLVQERTSGTLMLLRTTRHGRARLYLRKYAAMLCLLALGALALYGTNLTISAALLGLENLSQPIQSVNGFLACPVPFTVQGFLITMYGEKLLWLWMCSSLFFLLCVRPSSPALPLLILAGVGGVGIWMADSANLWVRSLSPLAMADSAARYRQCLLLPLGNLPVAEQLVCPLLCTILAVCGFFGGLYLFCTGTTVPVDAIQSGRRILPHTNLLRFETYKILLPGGGLALLVVLILAQLWIYSGYSTEKTIYQQQYTHYAQVLAGPPSQDKEEFLQAEVARFAQLEEKIAQAQANIQDEALLQRVTAEYYAQLSWQETFMDVQAQYTSLEDGESFVPRLGYEHLFGHQGRQNDLRSAVLLFLFLGVVLSGVMAREEETGVAVFLSTTGAVKQVNRRKFLCCGLLALAFGVAAFLPEWIYVGQMFGLDQLGAPASSLSVLGKLGLGLPIYGVLILAWMLRLAVSLLATSWVLFLSQRTKRSITTLLVAVGTLVIPTLAALIVM